MPKCNTDIREAIKLSGFPHWFVADRLGVTDTTFSRWLRKELPDTKKQEILQVIEEIKQQELAEMK